MELLREKIWLRTERLFKKTVTRPFLSDVSGKQSKLIPIIYLSGYWTDPNRTYRS